MTHDGGAHWREVTPPALTPWSKVSLMEASHFDTLEAFAAVNRIRLDDLHPHVWRTRDGGRTWDEIVTGIPDDEVVNVVREDPVRRGLLFAGTERTVYVSFDDGERWQSLRLNLPASSMRDLVVHENDLVLGTHGRSAWVLDDITPLRQLAEAGGAQDGHLFAPAPAVRVRWNTNTDTPLPPEEPAGQNPPDGAILDYYLPSAASGPVTLEVLDARGALVRRLSSDDAPEPVDSSANIPLWWVRPSQRLGTGAGMHRFVWDLHYPPPASVGHEYPIAAVPHDTPREPRGPWVLPGRYSVRLTVNGRTLTQPLSVRMDPRVHASAADLASQLASARRVADLMQRDYDALLAVRERRRSGGAAAGDSLASIERQLAALSRQLQSLYETIEGADAAPTSQALRALAALGRDLETALARWEVVRR